jgi:serine phosphatase RsbU (regulator of sigma subunit)
MSRGLKSMNFPRLGMAMTMVKINDNKLRLSSAGMPPMLLYRAATGKAEEVLLEGMPLGYMALAEYEEREFELSKGDTILLMSDGLPERMNGEDEWLDYPKTLEAFQSVGDKTPDEIIEHMVSVGAEWAKGRENDDDESFVCLKFKGKN